MFDHFRFIFRKGGPKVFIFHWFIRFLNAGIETRKTLFYQCFLGFSETRISNSLICPPPSIIHPSFFIFARKHWILADKGNWRKWNSHHGPLPLRRFCQKNPGATELSALSGIHCSHSVSAFGLREHGRSFLGPQSALCGGVLGHFRAFTPPFSIGFIRFSDISKTRCENLL